MEESINIPEAFKLSDEAKRQLLYIARNSIESYLKKEKDLKPEHDSLDKALLEHIGAFVTLKVNGKLRGCIGSFKEISPLFQTVQDMALSAAIRDSRFDPINALELDKMEIEISVLTPRKRIQHWEHIQLGKHGIYIRKGNRSGTFLPQVATKTGWNLEEFLGHCSRDKVGIGWNGWKDAELYIYEALIFGEKERI